MGYKIALAGNPNCGKTTLFNSLTGSKQYVGNWPGVTVEKKSGEIKGTDDELVDLPGIYSLSPYSMDEVVARDYLLNDHPDAIIDIVDATNIERNLYLTTQLTELGIPVVIALNMMDLFNKSGDELDVKKLEELTGCPVVEVSALKNTNVDALIKVAREAAKKGGFKPLFHYKGDLQKTMDDVGALLLRDHIVTDNASWYALKVMERDGNVLKKLKIPNELLGHIESMTTKLEDKLDDDSESIITDARYQYVTYVTDKAIQKSPDSMTVSDKIDQVVTNRWLAIPIFALIMWGVYYVAVSSVGAVCTSWITDTFFGEIVSGGLTSWMQAHGTAEWMISLVNDGIIGGVGSVLGFVPQIMILFFFISILEDCGYMARVAFIMDRLFRRFGLSGKSFIPMLIGTGCSVPAIMASRTIENEEDRRMTIMLTPFIPCSAKLPIFAMIAGAFFPGQTWVAPSMYFVGIIMVILSGILLKKLPFFSGVPAPFVMELPKYHIPSARSIAIHVWDRSKAFIIKAGTVIFIGCTVIWFLENLNWQMQFVDAANSMLASIGSFIAPLFTPLGFGNWQSTIAVLSGILAKENVVATFGILYGITNATDEAGAVAPMVTQLFSPVGAYAFMVFNLLASPCVASIATIYREMGGWKWTLRAICFQTCTAYVMAFIVNQIGSALLYNEGTVTAVILAVVFLAFIIWLFVSDYRGGGKKQISYREIDL
ncbi:MAG: ferrous iron transport protein B [Eubacteriaceae bacterium]|jgi:ferrous iron transport protein B